MAPPCSVSRTRSTTTGRPRVRSLSACQSWVFVLLMIHNLIISILMSRFLIFARIGEGKFPREAVETVPRVCKTGGRRGRVRDGVETGDGRSGRGGPDH